MALWCRLRTALAGVGASFLFHNALRSAAAAEEYSSRGPAETVPPAERRSASYPKTLADRKAKESKRASIPHGFTKYRLKEVRNLTHDTRLFRVQLPDPDEELFLPAACTVQARIMDLSFGEIQRHYTPVSPNGTRGHFDLIIKNLKGTMTKRLWHLKAGDKIQFRRQEKKLKLRPNEYKTINMIAGGVGLPPMLHVIQSVLNNPEDKTVLNLIFCNKTSRDIMLREELEEMARRNPDRFKLHLAIDQMEEGWEGFVGYVKHQWVQKVFPKPGFDHIVLVCGPDQMLTKVCGGSYGGFAWSKTAGIQPTYPDANNTGLVVGLLGYLGWQRCVWDEKKKSTSRIQVYVF